MNNSRDARLVKMARECGFDDDALAYTEFSLEKFFDRIVEDCARVAEQQALVYSGEKNESTGCFNSANAIRTYGKKDE